MIRRALLTALTAGLCTGVTCTIRFDEGGNGGGNGNGDIGGPYVPLDDASAEITIRSVAGDDAVDVTARIRDRLGLTVWLQREQAVAVNSLELLGPTGGLYRRSLPAAGQYVVTVREPTRGVEETLVTAPPELRILEPTPGGAVSLSGFTLRWSDADPGQNVTVTLTQVLFGSERRKTFGSLSDTGSRALGAGDLAVFRQGADLLIEITRRSNPASLAGFRSGSLVFEQSDNIAVSPGP